MKSRTSLVLVASFLFLFFGFVPLGAQLVWVGGQSTGSFGANDATDPANWTGGILAGNGSDNVFFGDTGTRNVYIGTDAALTNISFGNGSSAAFGVHGDDDGSSLTVLGNLAADPGSSAIFNEDLDVFLTEGSHTANIGSAASITIGSRIDDASGATGGIIKTGDGNLTLGGANLFTGGVTVSGGTLTLAHDSNYDGIIFSSPVGLGTLTLNSGSTLTMSDEYSYGLYNDIQLDASGGTVHVDVPTDSSLHLASYISGTAGLDKSGDGKLILSNGTNDFSGGFSVHEGTLLLAASSQTEGSAVISGPVGTGGLKLYDGTKLGVDTGSPVSLHNAIELDCRSEAKVDIWTNTGNTLNLYGVVSGASELNKTGSGTLNLYGNNTFTGDFYVSGGIVNVNSNTGTGLGALEMGLSTSRVNFTTAAPVIHGLSADAAGDSIYLANGSTLTINQNENSTFAGSLDGHVGASIVKSGTGTLSFTQSNDYDGTTTISGGTLVYGANGAFGTSSVTINGGALKIANGTTFTNTLALTSGTLAGNYTFNTLQTFGTGITLSPGNSPGTMTFAAGLTPNNGLSTDIEINGATNNPGTSSDLIVTGGAGLNLSSLSAGGYTLRVISLSLMNSNSPGAVDDLTGAGSWIIFQNSALTGFNANLFTIDSTGFEHDGTFSLTVSVNDIVLNFTPVPEPSTYALMALGLASGGLAAWRKRRRA